jgi:hypothetical protein
MKGDQIPCLKVAKKIKNGVFVEVGTWEGDFSFELLNQTDCVKLYCVDPYKHFTNNEYPDGMNNLTQYQFDEKFNTVNNRFKQFGSRVEFLRMESVEASKLFSDNSIDFVYIDGNHDYKYVKSDIESWWSKVKTNGWLCGDDVYSTDLNEHDNEGNILRIWSRDTLGHITSWGKYGTYKALKDLETQFNYKPSFNKTQFLINKN